MKTNTILVILAIIVAALAIFFLVRKPADDMTLDTSTPIMNDLSSTEDTASINESTVVEEEQTIIVEPTVTPETPTFPTTGVKPE